MPWHVESRIPELPESRWTEVYTWPDEGMTESEAEEVITIYRRAMPGKEYRKVETVEIADEDIPF